MMDILVALLELGNVKFTDEDKAKVTEETKCHVGTWETHGAEGAGG